MLYWMLPLGILLAAILYLARASGQSDAPPRPKLRLSEVMIVVAVAIVATVLALFL
jgi:hypothetical protein